MTRSLSASAQRAIERRANHKLAVLRRVEDISGKDFLVTPVGEYRFAGHLSVANHELVVDAYLSDQVGDYLRRLPIEPPPVSFDAEWFSLFAFRADWTARWWEQMTWSHLHLWPARHRKEH